MTIHFCKFCERYLQPPQSWIAAALESRELMALCLKKLKGLAAVKLIDASFLWTEPHSKRLKIKMTIQAEVTGGAILQQTFVVEYTVAYQMCPDCHRVEAKDHWNCLVQVRQKTKQRKTLFFLEQLVDGESPATLLLALVNTIQVEPCSLCIAYRLELITFVTIIAN